MIFFLCFLGLFVLVPAMSADLSDAAEIKRRFPDHYKRRSK